MYGLRSAATSPVQDWQQVAILVSCSGKGGSEAAGLTEHSCQTELQKGLRGGCVTIWVVARPQQVNFTLEALLLLGGGALHHFDGDVRGAQ